MNTKLKTIALNRLKTLAVNESILVSSRLKAIFLTELSRLGYKVVNPDLLNDFVYNDFDLIIDELIKIKGGDVDYVPMFNGFPERVPEKNEFITKRILGILGNVIGLFSENDKNVQVLENGVVIPNWIFDLTEFGADPIFGRQTESLYQNGLEAQKGRSSESHTEWIELKVSDNIEHDLLEFMLNNLYAKSSIKESLKDDLEYLINYFGLGAVNPSKVVFKEIKSYLMKYLWERGDFNTLSKFIDTPTDLLRLFASLTDSDISLSEKIKFPKMNRKTRRWVLSQLESCSDLPENLNQYRGLWLALGRYIHPGEYTNKYPKTAKAFDLLRNGKIKTFNGKVEEYLQDKQLDKLLALLKTRPGIFARKLHHIVVKFKTETGVISAFKKVIDKIKFKNLLVLQKYFMTINDSDYRQIINKKGKMIILPNNKKGELSQKRINKLLKAIDDAIVKKCKNTPFELDGKVEKVWIDPAFKQYLVPLSLRKQSDGLLNIARGSQVSIDMSKTLRLFTYWKQNSYATDFDLSAITFDENLKYKDHVSYTNLSNDGITHSGDIQSAPYGASEFIDIDLGLLQKKYQNNNNNARYIGIQVLKYRGESFTQVEKSYAGWMFREDTDSNHSSFDIKTVANKFNMVGKGSYAIPLIVDLKEGKVIVTDLYMNGENNFNNVEGAVNDISIITREAVNMVNTKPNMFDLIYYRLSNANVELVSDKNDADFTYGVNDCDLSIDRVDEILANFLI